MYPRTFLILALLLTIAASSTNSDDHGARGESVDRAIKISSISNTSPMQEERFILPLLKKKSTVIMPETTAEIVSVATLNNNRIHAQFHAANRHPIASITKLMTAIVAKEQLNGTTPITIQEEDVATEGPAGDFAINEIFSVDDLIKAMLAVSSNDAAAAIARTVGTQKFVDAMQRKARELEMDNTTFFDPHGLSSLNQSTAEDLQALMVVLRRDHDDLLRITRAKSVTITDQRNQQFRMLKNINEFAGTNKFEGGKTGYTDEARGNLMSLFTIDNEPVLITVLGSSDRFGDTRMLYDWAERMLK